MYMICIYDLSISYLMRPRSEDVIQGLASFTFTVMFDPTLLVGCSCQWLTSSWSSNSSFAKSVGNDNFTQILPRGILQLCTLHSLRQALPLPRGMRFTEVTIRCLLGWALSFEKDSIQGLPVKRLRGASFRSVMRCMLSHTAEKWVLGKSSLLDQ